MTSKLLIEILAGYPLKYNGVHGINHWARVFENGRRLAAVTGADPLVVDLFAVFHDARRRNEGEDPGHGSRGAKLARKLRKKGLIELDDGQLDLLVYACARHTAGETESDPTIGTCWDADRLDLARVGIRPDLRKLSTDAAKDPEVLDWAFDRGWREVRSTALEDGLGSATA